MKIHIIGCSGSGKTYLANALSKKYNISYFDLDDIQWDNNAKEYGKKRTLDERKALLQEILYNNDEWIIEGVYYAWVQQSFDEADKIYVLDMPGYLYKSRIIMRSIKRKFGIQKGKRETLKSVYNLLKWTETFQNKNLKEIRSILDRYDDKVIWLSRKKRCRENNKGGMITSRFVCMVNLNCILAIFPEWGQKVPPLSLCGGEKRPHI